MCSFAPRGQAPNGSHSICGKSHGRSAGVGFRGSRRSQARERQAAIGVISRKPLSAPHSRHRRRDVGQRMARALSPAKVRVGNGSCGVEPTPIHSLR